MEKNLKGTKEVIYHKSKTQSQRYYAPPVENNVCRIGIAK